MDKLSSAPKVLYKVTTVPTNHSIGDSGETFKRVKILYKVAVVSTSESIGDSGKTFKRAKSTVLSSGCIYESEALETVEKFQARQKYCTKLRLYIRNRSTGDSGETFKRAKTTVLSSGCTYESEALETVEKLSSAPKVLYKVVVVCTKQKHWRQWRNFQARQNYSIPVVAAVSRYESEPEGTGDSGETSKSA